MINSSEIIALDVRIPAKEEYVEAVRSDLSIMARVLGFSGEKEQDLIIAVCEACLNVISHAYNGNHLNSNIINIRYWLYPEKLAVIVKDYGKGFDIHFVRRYITSADGVVPGKVGLGIFVIKTLMDEVEYESTIDKGTSVTMIKYK